MKKRYFCCLLLLMLLALLPSCAKKDCLYTVSDGDRTISVLGNGKHANYLSVSENGEVIWEKRVYADHTIGSNGGNWGLRVTDVNFDGLNDLIIAITTISETDKAGKIQSEQVYLQQSDGSYQLAADLDGKCNIEVDTKQELVFCFSFESHRERDVETEKTYTVTEQTAIAYSWRNGSLQPRRRVTLTYYGKADRYCYAVSDYDSAIGAWADSDDTWLTPEDYQTEPFEGLYYYQNFDQ